RHVGAPGGRSVLAPAGRGNDLAHLDAVQGDVGVGVGLSPPVAWLLHQSRQNSLPSGSCIVTQNVPISSFSYSLVAPSPTSSSSRSLRRARRASPSSPGADRTSRCTRFLAAFPSGTFWKKMRGPFPSGSRIALWSFHRSSGMPIWVAQASQDDHPSGGGSSM